MQKSERQTPVLRHTLFDGPVRMVFKPYPGSHQPVTALPEDAVHTDRPGWRVRIDRHGTQPSSTPIDLLGNRGKRPAPGGFGMRWSDAPWPGRPLPAPQAFGPDKDLACALPILEALLK